MAVSAKAIEREDLHSAIWPEGTDPPTRKLTCRHCDQPNRVQVPRAVLFPEKHDCGECGEPLFLKQDEPLTDLDSTAYEHSLDRKSLEALRSLPGFPQVAKWVGANIAERQFRVHQLSSGVRCGEDQFPELLRLCDTARERLGVGNHINPTLFLGESPMMNAMTLGFEETYVVVKSALLDQLTDDEVVAVLGHEIGHLHSGHPLYKSLVWMMLGGAMAFSGILRLLTAPIQKALLKWSRCAELTCDRAGLLATRDLGASMGVLLTMAGGSRPGTTRRTSIRLAPFIRQAREIQDVESESTADGIMSDLLSMNRSHPYVAWRVTELIRWVEDGRYLEILAGKYPRRKP